MSFSPKKVSLHSYVEQDKYNLFKKLLLDISQKPRAALVVSFKSEVPSLLVPIPPHLPSCSSCDDKGS